MTKKEQGRLLTHLLEMKQTFEKYYSSTQYSWRTGYNQAIFDISQYIKTRKGSA